MACGADANDVIHELTYGSGMRENEGNSSH